MEAGVSPSKQEAGTTRGGTALAEDVQMAGVDITRVLHRNSSGLSKMLAVGEQLDEVIGYTYGLSSIS